MKQSKQKKETSIEIVGVDEKTYDTVHLTITQDYIFIKEGRKESKYTYEEVEKVLADRSRLWLMFKNRTFTILNIYPNSIDVDFIEIEKEIQERSISAHINNQSKLYGAAKKQEKKFKKSYYRQIFVASCVVATATAFLTIGLSIVKYQSNNKIENNVSILSEREFSLKREMFLEQASDSLLNTKTELQNLINIIDKKIVLENNTFQDLLSFVYENQNKYKNKKIQDFSYDYGYMKYEDHLVETYSNEIYIKQEKLYNDLIELLKKQERSKSKYLDLKKDIDEINTLVDNLIRKVFSER